MDPVACEILSLSNPSTQQRGEHVGSENEIAYSNQINEDQVEPN